ncbi:hypothetical protein DFH09DRAFT_1348535 [Mycena vulgaris]|nr:hypothetical protein DFH09DRAFT_1349207 [Mycena vulgaris]KAJ6460421.1 hypothetical protein DFH09DRAFT_1348535 [Mycena vulgaris]
MDWLDAVSDLPPNILTPGNMEIASSLLCDSFMECIASFNYQTSTRHIQDLPDDVLAEILLLVPAPFYFLAPYYQHDLDVIRRICHRFRALVDNGARFYSSIYIDERTDATSLKSRLANSKNTSLVFEFRMLSGRSGDLPPIFMGHMPTGPNYEALDLHWKSMMVIVAPFMLRCISLTISGHTTRATTFLLKMIHASEGMDGSRIQTIFICGANFGPRIIPLPFKLPLFMKGNTPSLQTLLIEGMWISYDPMVYRSLSTLVLDSILKPAGPTIATLFAILCSAPRLVHLIVRALDTEGFDSYTSGPVSMEYLTHLNFAGNNPYASCFLFYLRLPALHTLVLDVPQGDDDVFSFIDHCEGILATVQDITLNIDIRFISPLVRLLRAMPLLRRLDTRLMSTQFYVHFHLAMTIWPGLCPMVETVIVSDYVETETIEALLLLVKRPPSVKRFTLVSPIGADSSGRHMIPYSSVLTENDKVVSTTWFGPYDYSAYNFF